MNLTVTVVFSVTVARAVELKHKASLISALTNETSKLFTAAGMFCNLITVWVAKCRGEKTSSCRVFDDLWFGSLRFLKYP